jgi:acetyl esterase/lipase
VITDQNDVLRDEGEAYAEKLAQAGVTVTSVRYNGTVHDFVMLNALADTAARQGSDPTGERRASGSPAPKRRLIAGIPAATPGFPFASGPPTAAARCP